MKERVTMGVKSGRSEFDRMVDQMNQPFPPIDLNSLAVSCADENGIIATDLVESLRDHARLLVESGERASRWSNDLVWALAAEVVIARESTA